MKYALIMLGGAAGSLLRFLVQGWTQTSGGDAFPFGTLLVNVAGCFAIGCLNALFAGPWPIRADYRAGIIVGLLGGFTTFSAFGWETFSLANEGQVLRAFVYVLASVALGLAAVWAGYRLGARWFVAI